MVAVKIERFLKWVPAETRFGLAHSWTLFGLSTGITVYEKIISSSTVFGMNRYTAQPEVELIMSQSLPEASLSTSMDTQNYPFPSLYQGFCLSSMTSKKSSAKPRQLIAHMTLTSTFFLARAPREAVFTLYPLLKERLWRPTLTTAWLLVSSAHPLSRLPQDSSLWRRRTPWGHA